MYVRQTQKTDKATFTAQGISRLSAVNAIYVSHALLQDPGISALILEIVCPVNSSVRRWNPQLWFSNCPIFVAVQPAARHDASTSRIKQSG